VQTELDNARTAEMTAQEVQKKLQLHSESADQLVVAIKVSVLLYLFALVSNKNPYSLLQLQKAKEQQKLQSRLMQRKKR
jgi:hypothetical protein